MPHRVIWSWHTGRWWMGCYIPYSEKGIGWGRSPPRPLLAVPIVTAHPSTASVLITVLLYNGPLLCGFNVSIKWLNTLHPSIIQYFWDTDTRVRYSVSRIDHQNCTVGRCRFSRLSANDDGDQLFISCRCTVINHAECGAPLLMTSVQAPCKTTCWLLGLFFGSSPRRHLCTNHYNCLAHGQSDSRVSRLDRSHFSCGQWVRRRPRTRNLANMALPPSPRMSAVTVTPFISPQQGTVFGQICL